MLSIPPPVPAPSCSPSATATVPAAASILPLAQALCILLLRVPCLLEALPSSESLHRPPGPLPPTSPHCRRFPALCRERVPVGGPSSGLRWRWGWDPLPHVSRPTPSSSPAHNRSVRREERGGGGAPAWGLRASWKGWLKEVRVQGLELTSVGRGCTRLRGK